MQACKVFSTIGPDRKLVLDVPKEIPPGEVEVIILASQSSPSPKKQSLLRYLDDLGQRPRKTRAKEAIDRELRAERGSWQW